MARSVFFSFHYQRDIFRVQQVKQHYVTKGTYTAAGYFDGSLEEKAKKEGEDAVKRLIDAGLKGSTVLCVLIGNQTATRHWVYYEILKAIEFGMGVFGIRIHNLKDINNRIDAAGGNPFGNCGYSDAGTVFQPMIKYDTGWANAPYLNAIDRNAVPYLKNTSNPLLSSFLSVYDWVTDDGYNNFQLWVEQAANQSSGPTRSYRLL